MNLHGIVAPIIAAVNPNQQVQIATGTGSTTALDGTRTPSYSIQSVPAQIQALTSPELRMVDNLNVQGDVRAVYFYGDVTGLLRASQVNGTLVKFADGSVWMVFVEFEPWGTTAGWSKVGVNRQQASVWPG